MSDSPAPDFPAPDSLKPDPVPDGRGALWFARGMLAASKAVQGYVLAASFVGFGGLIRDIGFPLGAALLATPLIWALPAQVLLVGGFAAGSAAPVIALAVGLSSVRLFPMTASILPYLRNPGGGIGVQFLAAHFVAVTAWFEGVRLLPQIPRAVRLPFFFGLAITFILMAIVGLVAGFLLAGTLPRELAMGLLFLTPLSFLLQLVRNARDSVDWLALGFGLLLAPVMAEYGGGLDLLWTGLLGGGAAWAIHRLRRKRA